VALKPVQSFSNERVDIVYLRIDQFPSITYRNRFNDHIITEQIKKAMFLSKLAILARGRMPYITIKWRDHFSPHYVRISLAKM
jgi:hypothetical protein